MKVGQEATQVSLLFAREISDMSMHGLGGPEGTGSTYWDRGRLDPWVDMQGHSRGPAGRRVLTGGALGPAPRLASHW